MCAKLDKPKGTSEVVSELNTSLCPNLHTNSNGLWGFLLTMDIRGVKTNILQKVCDGINAVRSPSNPISRPKGGSRDSHRRMMQTERTL